MKPQYKKMMIAAGLLGLAIPSFAFDLLIVNNTDVPIQYSVDKNHDPIDTIGAGDFTEYDSIKYGGPFSASYTAADGNREGIDFTTNWNQWDCRGVGSQGINISAIKDSQPYITMNNACILSADSDDAQPPKLVIHVYGKAKTGLTFRAEDAGGFQFLWFRAPGMNPAMSNIQ